MPDDSTSRTPIACTHCGCSRLIVERYADGYDIADAICCLTADAPHPTPTTERHQP